MTSIKFQFFITVILVIFLGSCDESSNDSYTKSSSSSLVQETITPQSSVVESSSLEEKVESVDICRCLTEPQNSEYNIKHETACDDAIDKELGVVHWSSINFRENKAVSQRWDELVYRCTGKRPNHAEIAGEYVGTNNFGSLSVIRLYNSGTLIIQSDGLDMIGGRWSGTTDDLNLYSKDEYGNEIFFANAKVTEDGLQITSGGGFYRRR